MEEDKVYRPYIWNNIYSIFTFLVMLLIDVSFLYGGRFVPGLLIAIPVLSVLFRMVIPNLTTKVVLKPQQVEYHTRFKSLTFSFDDIKKIIWDKRKGLRKSTIEIVFSGGGISFNPSSFKNMEECIDIVRKKATKAKLEILERD